MNPMRFLFAVVLVHLHLLVGVLASADATTPDIPLLAATASSLRKSRQTAPWAICGCRTSACSAKVWNSNAQGPSCGDRILWLTKEGSMTGEAACQQVGGDEFPEDCGPCACQRDAQALQEVPQQQQQQPQQAPESTSGTCGCSTCTSTVLQRDAEGFSCGARIDYLKGTQSESAACRQVGGLEFVAQCGACNPDTCNGGTTTTTTTTTATTNPPQQQQQSPSQFTPPMDNLYCFPPVAQRTRYENVWGKYSVEVKEGDTCGPSDNLFSNSGVSVQNNNNEVTLQIAKRDGRWHSSEVRVLLPASEYFDYGRYSFSVKSIQVHDTSTPNNQVVSTTLPPSIILGLFTWDTTDNYAIRENFSHEVDIELARWDLPDSGDAQFLVQPPGFPQMYRFYTGATNGGQEPPPAQQQQYRQAPQTYEFDWEPADILWKSSAGGGQSFRYTTQDALSRGQPDYTQCMPAQVEVRINLWHLHGSFVQPTDMEDSHVIQVVIDNFTYEPSGRTGVTDGGLCSKDCQCQPGSQCRNQVCTKLSRSFATKTSAKEVTEVKPSETTTAPLSPLLNSTEATNGTHYDPSSTADGFDPSTIMLIIGVVSITVVAFIGLVPLVQSFVLEDRTAMFGKDEDHGESGNVSALSANDDETTTESTDGSA